MAKTPEQQNNDSFHLKFRPQTLSKVIGSEKLVHRLNGIIKTGRVPNAMLFHGPSSSGKTTLARAFVADLFGVKSLVGQSDFHEMNAAEQRGIDDARALVQSARLKPRTAPFRIILIDEAQGLTPAAINLLLKPIEQPAPLTRFIFGSMEPERLPVAIKNRCSSFAVEAPTQEGITKYLKRIAKREELGWVQGDVLETLVQNANGEFRTAAHLIEAVVQYLAGSGIKTPKAKDIDEALSSLESADDALAVQIVTSIYQGKFKTAHRAALDVRDGYRTINTVFRLSQFLLHEHVLGGERNRNVWWSQINKDVKNAIQKLGTINPKKILDAHAVVQNHMVTMKQQASSFTVSEQSLLSNTAFVAITDLRARGLYAKE